MRRPPPLLTMIGFSMLGNSSLVVQPMIVGGLVEKLGFTERQAGITASVELSGLSFGMVLLLLVGRRCPPRLLGLAAIAAVVLANLLACTVHHFEEMLLVRFAAGFGAAMALAGFLAMAASQEMPENTFAVVNAVSIAYSGVLTPFAPHILAAWGLAGLFLTLAAIALLMLPLTLGLHYGSSSAAPSKHDQSDIPSLPLSRQVLLLLMMMLLLYTGHGAIWAYQQRIGVGLGLTNLQIGNMIGMSMLIGGVGGSLAARVLGLRLGRVFPQYMSLGASALGAMLLVWGNPLVFAAACGLVAFSWFYGLPYQMGLLAAFDPLGRANMAGVVMTTGGAAAGPAIAALLVPQAGHAAIGAFAAACYAGCLLLVMPGAIALNHGSRVRVSQRPVG
jgi:predicted MFS family arabinose efflux permease